MPHVSGFLRVTNRNDTETDPGFGIDLGHGVDNTLPPGPPAVFPPLTWNGPIQIAPPGTPPGTIWPPLWTNTPLPGYGLPSVPGHPGAGLPSVPGHPSGGPVPPSAGTKPPSNTYWVVVGIPGIGWRYAAVDPSLEVGGGLPVTPGHPDVSPPTPPVRPGAGLPVSPGHPDVSPPTPPARPDVTPPTPPVRPDAGLPPTATPRQPAPGTPQRR